jgi:hypothetical protein
MDMSGTGEAAAKRLAAGKHENTESFTRASDLPVVSRVFTSRQEGLGDFADFSRMPYISQSLIPV